MYVIPFSLLLVVSELTSCATSRTTVKSSVNDSSPASSSGQWVIVSENPVTFFPKDLTNDTKTDFANGEWVYSKELNVQWFIPKGGTENRTSEELSAEALSMRTEGDKRRKALRGAGVSIAEFGVKSFWTSVVLSAGFVAGLGGWSGDGLLETIDRVWE